MSSIQQEKKMKGEICLSDDNGTMKWYRQNWYESQSNTLHQMMEVIFLKWAIQWRRFSEMETNECLADTLIHTYVQILGSEQQRKLNYYKFSKESAYNKQTGKATFPAPLTTFPMVLIHVEVRKWKFYSREKIGGWVPHLKEISWLEEKIEKRDSLVEGMSAFFFLEDHTVR